MKKIIDITKEYIETLLSLHVTEIENNEESAENFFNQLAPSMAGTSYTPASILKYFNTIPEKTIYDIEDCFFLKWAVIKLPEIEGKNSFLALGP